MNGTPEHLLSPAWIVYTHPDAGKELCDLHKEAIIEKVLGSDPDGARLLCDDVRSPTFNPYTETVGDTVFWFMRLAPSYMDVKKFAAFLESRITVLPLPLS